MSALSDALVEANVEGWSAREIARRSGDRVSHSQIGKYLKPSHPRPGEEVLQVFSDVLRIPMPRLRELAGMPAGGAEPYEPPAEANRLDSRQRRVVNELIRMLVETKAGDGDVDRDAASMNERPLRAVASDGDPQDAEQVRRQAKATRRRQTGDGKDS